MQAESWIERPGGILKLVIEGSLVKRSGHGSEHTARGAAIWEQELFLFQV
jgi:hypothetical protein